MERVISSRRDIVVVGGSAGGIEALKELISLLPGDFQGALFIVIHIGSDFPSILPTILRNTGSLPAFHPKDKEPVRPGSIYVAPPDFHLLFEDGVVRISRGPRENRCRPAIDPLFRTAARAYRSRTAGVVLSGQLDDGAAGLLAIKMAGGFAIVQDPAEALYPEMPSRALQYAGADCVLPVSEIAALLVKLSREPLRPPEDAMTHEVESEARKSNLEEDANNEKTGKPSVFSCPECHGVLWELEEGNHLRFRCRVGHAYTAAALRVALSESTEDALWAAMRVLEEKANLLRRMALGANGRYEDQAKLHDRHAKTIRAILIENQNSIHRENQAGLQEIARNMPKHRLTKEEQRKGVNAALESPRTPPQLKRGLRKRREQLESSTGGNGARSSSQRQSSKRNNGSRSKSSRS